ncbi:uncharacterized protein B0P05DRAFT_583731 [Gilbertella persicaria]|uniref:uncharacterized protein n=1 Tax=Gilbertella persicaria TaxID=101096 RepID=UPI002221094E|nr:uncharacterized protein B0P05DRAFT_583731 [Gilbertella persicaria]KAI8091206.1 hypothetical protein B0P05DRAFT_583731 [Gilbertella persicaria]
MSVHTKPTLNESESIDSLPIPPKELLDKSSWSFIERQPMPTLPVFEEEEEETMLPQTPPFLAFVKGHTHHFLKSALQFIFKDNNLPLMINIIYHLFAAKSLISRPSKVVARYLDMPPTVTLASHAPLRHQIEQTGTVAVDAFRTQGVLHLALGLLGTLALKEKRQSSERSALTVLTLASVGQAWTHLDAYWKSKSYYTLKALQEVGLSDVFIAMIGMIALFKTTKRTGKLF